MGKSIDGRIAESRKMLENAVATREKYQAELDKAIAEREVLNKEIETAKQGTDAVAYVTLMRKQADIDDSIAFYQLKLDSTVNSVDIAKSIFSNIREAQEEAEGNFTKDLKAAVSGIDKLYEKANDDIEKGTAFLTEVFATLKVSPFVLDDTVNYYSEGALKYVRNNLHKGYYETMTMK